MFTALIKEVFGPEYQTAADAEQHCCVRDRYHKERTVLYRRSSSIHIVGLLPEQKQKNRMLYLYQWLLLPT